MSILSLSHTDLDGVSAQIVLRQHLGEVTKMNCSYGKIDEYLEIVYDYCTRTKPNKVFITDLSFTYKQLKKLYDIAELNKEVIFYFIDHHPFKEDYKKLITQNFNIIISKKASATKLTHLYLKKNMGSKENKGLDEFVEYTNTYDLWITEDAKFKASVVYNDLFWEYKRDYFFNRFKDEFKLRNSDKEKFKDLMNKKMKLFNKLDNSGRVFRHEPDGNKRIFMIFLDDFKNHIPLDYPGFDVYILVSSYGGISVRLKKGLSDDGSLKDEISQKSLEHENIGSAGGHPQAFGMMLNDASAHNQVEFSKFLLKVVDNGLDNLVNVVK